VSRKHEVSRNKRVPVRLRVAQHDAVQSIARGSDIEFPAALAKVIDRGLNRSTDKRRPSALSDDEAKTIIEACLLGHGNKGASQDEIARCLSWANGVKAEQALLELVLEGKTVIAKTKKNALVLDEIVFAMRKT